MPLDVLFWVLMIIWLILGTYVEYSPGAAPAFRGGRGWLGWIIIALLGWKVFGSIVK